MGYGDIVIVYFIRCSYDLIKILPSAIFTKKIRYILEL